MAAWIWPAIFISGREPCGERSANPISHTHTIPAMDGKTFRRETMCEEYIAEATGVTL